MYNIEHALKRLQLEFSNIKWTVDFENAILLELYKAYHHALTAVSDADFEANYKEYCKNHPEERD